MDAREFFDSLGGNQQYGAIRTAVCCFDVVAPPIRSGRDKPRRSISCAASHSAIASAYGRQAG